MSKQEKKQKPSKKIELTNKQKKMFNGGLKGGVARAEKLSPRKRRQISIKANKARWKKTS